MAERIRGLQIDLSMKDMGVNRTLAEIKRSFKGLNADLKLSNNNFKYSEKSLNSYKLRTRELSQAVKESKANVAALKAKYQEVSRESGVNSKKAAQLRQEYSRQADNLNYLQNELDQTRGKYREMIAVSKSSIGRLGQTFSEIGPKMKSIGESMKSVGRNMSLHVTAPIVAGFGAAMKKSIDFDDTMRKVKATSGATGNEFNQLREKALQMGRDTKFTASESAEAMNFMALAGWDTKDMLKGVGGVMNLAAASGEDLASVSDIVTDNLTAFGMKAKDSTHFADVLAQTSSKANTDVRGLGEAFKYAAPVAGALGYTVEDTSIAIGLMSNAGIKGEKAGTALRTMFTNLSKPTKAMKDEMDKLGISITDSNGEMLPMRDVLDQLRGKMGGLSKDQQAAAASTIFGKEAMSGALAVINASDEDYKKLTKSIDGSNGASKRMANEMEGGIGGAMRKMKSAIESLAISLGDALAPMLYKVATWVTKLASKFSNLPSGVQKTIAVVGLLAAAIGPLVLVMGMFTSAIGSIATTLGPVMVDIAKAGGLMNFLGTKAPFAAKGLTLVGGAFKFMLGPVGLAIAAIAAIGTAFVIAYKKSETFRNIVNAVIGPVVNAFKNLWNTAEVVFNALKNLFSGNTLPTVDILSKIMPKATAIKVTATLMQIRQVFIDVFNAIWQFGQDIGLKLGQFWNQNGATIMQAVTNIWNTIVTVFTEVKNFLWPILQELGGVVKTVFMNVIVPAVKIGMQIIWGVMKFLWPLIKILVVDTWNNIKNIINGALDIILGIVKIFSGLFTGQWKQVWNGIKQVFSGALTLIWNLIQLWFIGKILKVVKVFGGFFKSIISKAFNGVKTVIGTVLKFIWSIISNIFKRILAITRSIFGAVLKFIRFIFNTIKNFISKIVKSIYNNVKKWFTLVWDVTKSIFGKLKNWLSKTWRSIKNKVTDLAKALWSGVKNAWNNLKKGTTKTFKAVGSFMSSKWSSIKSNTVKKAKGTWSGVKGAWGSLSKGTHKTMNSVGSFMSKKWRGIKNSTVNLVTGMKNKITGVMDKMGNVIKSVTGKIKGFFKGMISGVGKGLNGLIKGVNWVGKKLGMDALPKVKLHTGTESTHTQNIVTNGKVNRDTFATVGDKGRGNGPGGFRHEMIRYPNGKTTLTPNRDTTTFLPKGSSVINGKQTHSILNNLPKFSKGTSKKKRNLGDFGNYIKGKFGEKASQAAHGIKQGTQKALEKSANAIGKGKSWLEDKIGDVMDWVGKPGKLFEKIADAFGINIESFGIPKKASLPFDMMKGMFGKLKTAAIDMIKNWMEEAEGGDGDAAWLFKHPIWQKFGSYTGGLNFNGGRHYGVDFGMPIGTNVYAVKGGKADKVWTDYGGGKSVQIKTGQGEWNWYMHLSKQIAKQGQRIKPGQLIGKSGDTGNFVRGAHLHFQLMKGSHAGNDTAKDPLKWLKSLEGGGKSGKWNGDVKKALKIAGLPTTGAYVKAWQKQIQTESGGNPKALGGTDGLADGRAKGLVQVKPGTFNAYKAKGHGNIWNGLDNLIAGMKYAKARYGKSGMLSVVGKGHGYATGGLINSSGLYNLAEGGHPEFVIPTDPSRQSDAMKLLAIASQRIEGNKKNKRPNQMRTPSTGNNNDNEMINFMARQLEATQRQVELLTQLVASNQRLEKKPTGVSEQDISKAQGKRAEMMAYNLGGAY